MVITQLSLSFQFNLARLGSLLGVLNYVFFNGLDSPRNCLL